MHFQKKSRMKKIEKGDKKNHTVQIKGEVEIKE